MLLSTWHRLKSASLVTRTLVAIGGATLGTAGFLGAASLVVLSVTEAIAGEAEATSADASEVVDGEPVVIATDPAGERAAGAGSRASRSGLTPGPRSGTSPTSAGAPRTQGPEAPEGEDGR
jgi:hypothetical protein